MIQKRVISKSCPAIQINSSLDQSSRSVKNVLNANAAFRNVLCSFIEQLFKIFFQDLKCKLDFRWTDTDKSSFFQTISGLGSTGF